MNPSEQNLWRHLNKQNIEKKVQNSLPFNESLIVVHDDATPELSFQLPFFGPHAQIVSITRWCQFFGVSSSFLHSMTNTQPCSVEQFKSLLWNTGDAKELDSHVSQNTSGASSNVAQPSNSVYRSEKSLRANHGILGDYLFNRCYSITQWCQHLGWIPLHGDGDTTPYTVTEFRTMVRKDRIPFRVWGIDAIFVVLIPFLFEGVTKSTQEWLDRFGLCTRHKITSPYPHTIVEFQSHLPSDIHVAMQDSQDMLSDSTRKRLFGPHAEHKTMEFWMNEFGLSLMHPESITMTLEQFHRTLETYSFKVLQQETLQNHPLLSYLFQGVRSAKYWSGLFQLPQPFPAKPESVLTVVEFLNLLPSSSSNVHVKLPTEWQRDIGLILTNTNNINERSSASPVTWDSYVKDLRGQTVLVQCLDSVDRTESPKFQSLLACMLPYQEWEKVTGIHIVENRAFQPDVPIKMSEFQEGILQCVVDLRKAVELPFLGALFQTYRSYEEWANYFGILLPENLERDDDKVVSLAEFKSFLADVPVVVSRFEKRPELQLLFQ